MYTVEYQNPDGDAEFVFKEVTEAGTIRMLVDFTTRVRGLKFGPESYKYTFVIKLNDPAQR